MVVDPLQTFAVLPEAAIGSSFYLHEWQLMRQTNAPSRLNNLNKEKRVDKGTDCYLMERMTITHPVVDQSA
jgi:hypothetical protein